VDTKSYIVDMRGWSLKSFNSLESEKLGKCFMVNLGFFTRLHFCVLYDTVLFVSNLNKIASRRWQRGCRSPMTKIPSTFAQIEGLTSCCYSHYA